MCNISFSLIFYVSSVKFKSDLIPAEVQEFTDIGQWFHLCDRCFFYKPVVVQLLRVMSEPREEQESTIPNMSNSRHILILYDKKQMYSLHASGFIILLGKYLVEVPSCKAFSSLWNLNCLLNDSYWPSSNLLWINSSRQAHTQKTPIMTWKAVSAFALLKKKCKQSPPFLFCSSLQDPKLSQRSRLCVSI